MSSTRGQVFDRDQRQMLGALKLSCTGRVADTVHIWRSSHPEDVQTIAPFCDGQVTRGKVVKASPEQWQFTRSVHCRDLVYADAEHGLGMRSLGWW
jgi:hypothetical protein